MNHQCMLCGKPERSQYSPPAYKNYICSSCIADYGREKEPKSGQPLHGDTSHECLRFNHCSAPLCPLDEGINDRIWYHDEEVCRAQRFNKRRWIRKQCSIQKRQTKSWLDKPISYQMLFDASRPRIFTLEQPEKMRERGRQLHKKAS